MLRKMKMMSGNSIPRCFAVLFYVLLLWPAMVQGQKSIATHSNSWFMYFGNHRISDSFGIHSEYQWRRNDGVANWQQSLLRFGLDWHVNPNLMVTGGYGWINSYPYGQQPIAFTFDEHRIWQQLVHQHHTSRFYFHHRYRVEQRFLETVIPDAEGEPMTEDYRFRNRARYRLFVTIPISRRELEDNTLFLGVYDEVFLGFGRGIGKNILDQNRLFFSLGWRFNDNFNVQLGYLNHYVIKPDGIRHERNHTLQVAVTYNLDFR